MTHDEFNELYPIYSDAIEGIARKLARNNNDLKDDLYNLGLIALWRLDPKQCKENRDAWITSAARNRMIDYLRKQRNYSYDSLDALLGAGFQVTTDVGTGDAVLVHNQSARSGPRMEDPMSGIDPTDRETQ